MRSILLFFGICAAPYLWAQSTPDQRTTTTKIADLLARMPSANAQQHVASMQLIETLGEKGLEELSLMLKDREKSDNTLIEYALSGFSFFVSDGQHEPARRTAATAYTRALTKTSVLSNKVFLINQLEIVGDDDIAGYLVQYLGDSQLADPAIRALVQINTPFTRKALLNSLYASSGTLRLRLVEALGDVRSAGAVPALTNLLNTRDKQLQKLVLYALSRIADPRYLNLLQKEASTVSFGFDTVGATGAYLSYLKNLFNKGFVAETDKAAWAVWNEAKNLKNKKARFAALDLLTQTRAINAIPLLVEAMKEQSRDYRVFALNLALQFVNNKEVSAWVNIMKSAEPELKRDLVEMLGRTGNITALPALMELINDKNPDVRLAAIKAACHLGGHEVQGAMIKTMKDADPTSMAAIKSCLLEMKGSGMNINELAGALPAMPNKAVAACIDILSARGASGRLEDVLPFVKSLDAEVRNAAFAALPSMSVQQTLPTLYSLLVETSDATHIKNIQSAIVTATSGISDTAKRIENILSALEKAPSSKQYLYYDVFAQIGGKPALLTVTEAFKKGDAETRMAVVNSLANWKDPGAAEPLYQIALQYSQHKDFDKVLGRYLDFVSKSKFTSEQRFLELRRAMEIAKNPQHRKAILKETGRCNTLPALLFAGKYLDNSKDQQSAANAVMRIALSDDNDWNGMAVKRILEKTIPLINGPDAEYQKNAVRKLLDEFKPGDGFIAMFNGKDLDGWKGLVENPVKRAAMPEAELKVAQAKADSIMQDGWEARDGLLIFKGKGSNLCTVKKYRDFEMFVDWKITRDGDAGIYLRGSPQVQVWDTSRIKVGAQVGSGGLYNNKIHPAKPLVLADNAIGAWNNFYIKMVGEKVTVFLNGKKVVDDVVLENYWDRKLPIFPFEQIELQAHGTYVAYRDLYIREIPRTEKFSLSEEEKKEGYQVLFDGTGLEAWQGNLTEYKIEQGELVVRPSPEGKHGNLYSKDEFGDFIYRLEFKLTPGANNGIGLRAPLKGDAAYEGLEVQMLDDAAPMYSGLKPFQYHGSVYGIIASRRGFLKPAGEWNYQEIKLKGNRITVTLNGTVIVDGDIAEVTQKGTLDNLDHPGLKRNSGHIAFLGHGDVVYMRNIRVRKL